MPAYSGCFGKEAVKRVSVCLSLCLSVCQLLSVLSSTVKQFRSDIGQHLVKFQQKKKCPVFLFTVYITTIKMMRRQRLYQQQQQQQQQQHEGNRAVHSRHPLPADRRCGLSSVPEEDRAADIGNKHKNLVKMARVVPEISSRTDRQTYSSQYFATAPAGEVTVKHSDDKHRS